MKKILIAITTLMVLIISGCKKDYFDVGPTGSADAGAIFTTTGNAANVMNGIYRYLYSRYDQQNQPGQGGIMLMFDFMGEDVHQAVATWYSPGNGTGGWVNHRNDSYDYTAYPFRMYYRCIGNANSLLDNIDAATGTEAERCRSGKSRAALAVLRPGRRGRTTPLRGAAPTVRRQLPGRQWPDQRKRSISDRRWQG